MAKSEKKFKQTLAANDKAIGHQTEQSVVSDDSLLPDAAEVEKYFIMDPNILHWLKERAEKEQDFRHESVRERTTLINTNEKRIHTINTVGLIFAFIFLLVGLLSSVYLIITGCSIAGSIFTGFTLLVGAGLLAGRKLPLMRGTPKKDQLSQ